MLGENILIDYNPYDLPVGTKLEIGEVVLEISQHCTLCKSLTKVDNALPKLLKNDRGIFAKVVKSGNISLKDKIKIKGV
jgi:MOSC domain-containing protein YiiM